VREYPKELVKSSVAQSTQIILWNCIKKSINDKKVCKSKKLDDILNKMQDNQDFISYNNTIKLLESAANGTKFDFHGQSFYITNEVADHTLKGLS